MSKPKEPQEDKQQQQSFMPQRTETGDALAAILDGASKLLFWGGLGATVLSVGFLIYTFTAFAGGATLSAAQASSNIELFQKLLVAGSLSLVVGTAYMWWGEETLGILQLMSASVLFFAPLYLPSLFSGGAQPTPVSAQALAAIQMGGIYAGIVAILVIVVDVSQRVMMRSRIGSKADQLKLGKGIKEESDIKNVFMGACWQLPFCRKFVRERCPIYHSRRCCWREKVGCMCEESVIRDAMAGKVIPKDAVAAAKFIPVNNQLTFSQKHERCKSCVIYNEHQKHKYKLLIPVSTLSFVGGYFLLREPLLAVTDRVFANLDAMINKATLTNSQLVAKSAEGLPFQEIMLVCFVVVVFTYVLKLIEFLVFKLKV